ncbi:MAG: hypothetical protein H6862_01970 [Rhodospirillales bacterium]|nr:hypothetical protein [Rhodospirillales bacterium]
MPDIFEEVDEALRRERVAALWGRHKVLIVAALVGVVVATGVYSGWRSWAQTRAEQATSALLAAQKATDKAAELEAFASAHQGDMRALALFEAADALAAREDFTKARDLYREIADAPHVSKIHRDRARILSARALAESADKDPSVDPDQAEAKRALVEMDSILAEKDNVWAPQARLAAAILAAYRLNDPARARVYLAGLATGGSQDIPVSLQRLAKNIDHVLALRLNAAAPAAGSNSKQEPKP